MTIRLTILSSIKCFATALFFLIPNLLLAWSGYDYSTGSYIEIESGNLVRTGNEIEYYDYATASYHYGTVESMSSGGGSVELEIYDYQTGEYRYFDMD